MRLETRGPANGACSLCGKHARLTEDHVPPKGVPRVGQARLVEIGEFLNGERASRNNRYFQRGVKYRSICAYCNNALLGKRYDPELIEFTRAVDTALSRQLYVPLQVKVRPDRLVRSVVGHLMAHGVALPAEGDVFVDLRAYFADEQSTLPARYQMYCWLYPYNDQFVAQALGVMTKMGSEFILMSVIKFYPVGFVLMQGEWKERSPKLARLDQMLTGDPDAESVLELPMSDLPRRRWPEAPDTDGAVMHTPLSRGAFRD